MKLRLMLTTLATILFLATACASEPTQAPDTRETDRLSRQVQQLQAENEAVRNELATLTASGTEQQQTPATETTVTDNPNTEISTPTPDEPDAKPSRPTDNICDRSPHAQEKLLSKLNVSTCSTVTGEDLFRIEEMDFEGTLWAGDLNDLVNLKRLKLTYRELPLPENILAGLHNLEALYVDIDLGNSGFKSRGDEPWAPDGMFTGTPNLKVLKINGPNVSLTKETLVLQDGFKVVAPSCLHGGRSGVSGGSGAPARCVAAYPPATAATPPARTVPGAASPAPPGTPGDG